MTKDIIDINYQKVKKCAFIKVYKETISNDKVIFINNKDFRVRVFIKRLEK